MSQSQANDPARQAILGLPVGINADKDEAPHTANGLNPYLAIVMTDVVNFQCRAVKQGHGHVKGQTALLQVAQALRVIPFEDHQQD
jgi:GGDEF domain-containing protein